MSFRVNRSNRSRSNLTTIRRRRLRTLEQLEARYALATWSWSGASGVDFNWATPGNWSLTSGSDVEANNLPDAGDDLVFATVPPGGSKTNTNNFTADTAFNSIAINDIGYTLQGNSVILNDTLTANYGAGTSTLSLSIGSDADGITVTKDGVGSLLITSANSYDGDTNVKAGNVRLQNAGALGSTNGRTIITNTTVGGGDGTFVQLESGITVAEPFTLVSNTTSDRRVSIKSAAGTHTLSGNIDLQGTGLNVLNSGGTLNVTGPITNSPLAGNPFTGTLFVRGGGGGTITNNVNLGATGNFSKTDTGTWGVSGSGHVWNNTTVADGTLRMDAANVLPNNTTLIMGQAGTFSPKFNLNGFSQTVAGLNLVAGSGGTKTIESTTGTPTLTLNGAGTYTYGGVLAGSLSLAKSGSGMQTLTGNNSYTGATTIFNGVLRASSNTALGTTAGNTLIKGNADNSGTLELINNVTIAEPITLEARQAASANAAHIRNVSGNNILSGTITGTTGGGEYNIYSDTGLLTLNGIIGNTNPPTRNLRFRGAGNGVVNGAITGTWTVHKQEAGTWLLAGPNTYEGTTTVVAGTLQLGSSTALGGTTNGTSVASGATLDLNGQTIAGEVITSIIGTGVGGNGALINSNTTTAAALQTAISGNNSFTVGGTGDLDLARVTGTASFTLTKVGAGALTLSGNQDNAYLQLAANGGTVNLAKTVGGGVRAADNATITAGTVKITAGGGDQINAALTINGGLFDLNGYTEAVSTLNGTGTIDNTAASSTSRLIVGSGAFSGIVQDSVGTLELEKTGGGELRLQNVNNTYSGGTFVSGGLLRASDRTIGEGNLTLSNGGQFFNVSGNGGTDGFNFEDNNFQRTVTLVGTGGGFRAGWGAMTISGQITGAGGFTVVNDGNITLTNTANDYAGNTTIGAGGSGNNATLWVGASEVIPSGPSKGNVVFNASSGGTATLDLRGFTETINGLVPGGAGANVVDNTTGNGTLVIGDADTSSTFGGTVRNTTGTLAVTKIGTGTVALVGTGITFRGNATVNGGTLSLQDTTSFANGSTPLAQTLSTANGATLEFAVSGTHNLGTDNGGVTIAGNGTVRKTGAGVLALDNQGNNNFKITMAMTGGVIDIQQGKIQNGGWQGQTWTNNKSSLNIASGAVFDIWDGNDVFVDALTGAGSFTRGQVNANRTLTVGVNGGSGEFTGTLANPSGLFNVVKTGAGVQTLSGSNNYSGTTTVSAGTLRLGHANALANGTGGTSVASGATLDLNGQAIAGETLTLAGTGVGSLGALINSSTTAASWSGTVNNGTYTVGGTGDITLSGQVSTSSSTLTKIGGGTLTLSGSQDNAGLAVVASGGTVVLAKTSSTSVRAVNGAGTVLTVNNGATVQLAGSGGDQIFTQGDVVVNTGGTLDLNGNSEGFDQLTGGGIVTNASGLVTLTVGEHNNGSTFTGQITGALTLRKVGGGEFVVTNGSNSYSGGTVVEAGLLRSTDNNLGSGNLTLNGGTFFNDNGSGNMTADGNFQKSVVLGTSGGGFRAGWNVLTISGPITGTGGLTIVNDNAITLTNTANSYDGNTTIGAGGSGNNATLRIGASEVIPHGAGKGVVVFNASGGGTATFDLAGFSETINGVVPGGAGANVIDNTTGNGTLTIGDNGVSSTFGGLIRNSSGTLSLQKIGSGVLTLSNANTYSGTTTVTAGTLLISNGLTGSATGTGNVTVGSSGTLGGDGRIQGHVNVSGTLSPGLAPNGLGTLTIVGDLALLANSSYAVDVQSGGNDQTSAANISIASTAQLAATVEQGIADGATFILLTGNLAADDQFATGVPNLPNDRELTFANNEQYFLTNSDPNNRFDTVGANQVALVRNRNELIAENNTYTMLQNSVLEGNVKSDATADNDPDLDAIVVVDTDLLTLPGELLVADDGTFSFTPNPDFMGEVTFSYHLTDGEYDSPSATVTINVTNIAVDAEGNLIVGGSTNNDRIIVQPTTGGKVSVRFNNALSPSFLLDAGVKVIVYGNNGNDTITVSGTIPVPVEIYGGEGDDYLSGSTRDDILDGGIGNDRLFGNNGNDELYGGEGNDSLSGGNGNDYLNGDQYIDLTLGRPGEILDADAPGRDILNGDGGNDILYGGGENDTLNGGLGNDQLYGGDGRDKLDGGDGHDLLAGEAGVDLLYGRAGRDILIGGDDADTIYGGTGIDAIYGGSVDLATLFMIWDEWRVALPADADAFLEDLDSNATEDGVVDAFNGEGDADWYLNYSDRFLVSSESRLPNKIVSK